MTQSGTNPSLPANLEMQGDSDKMQGTVSVNPAKIRRISAAWTGLSLLKEQGGNPCLAGNVRGRDGRRITGKDGEVLVERLTSTNVAIVIDEPNCRFWWSLIRESECAASACRSGFSLGRTPAREAARLRPRAAATLASDSCWREGGRVSDRHHQSGCGLVDRIIRRSGRGTRSRSGPPGQRDRGPGSRREHVAYSPP